MAEGEGRAGGSDRVDSPIRVVTEVPSLRERTAQVLRDAILSMHFKPGERLVERKLCDETGVSRTSIREALRHLEAEGLVARSPNKGMFVSIVDVDDARQIYEVRAALESDMGRHFVERADAAQFRRLRAAFEAIERTIFTPDVVAYVAALDAFSDALMDGAQNALARQLLGMLRARITFLRTITARAARSEQKKGTLAALGEILAAVERRDADGAARACRAYVGRSAAFALDLLRDSARQRSSA